MKKLLVTMLTILTCGAAYALPVGNPADPTLLTNGVFWDADCENSCEPCGFDWNDINFKFGYYGDFVFNRRLERKHHHSNATVDDRHGRTTLNTNAGYLAVGLWDRLDMFATLGGTNARFNTGAEAFGLEAGRISVTTETDFSWSVGAKAVLWECGCTVVGLEGQYFRSRPNVSKITLDDTNTLYTNNAIHLKYSEWQAGLGISHRINMFVPYVAVKYSRAISSFEGTVAAGVPFADFTSPSLRDRNHWGYAFGVSLVDCDIMSLNVEGRLGNERAIAVNAQVRF